MKRLLQLIVLGTVLGIVGVAVCSVFLFAQAPGGSLTINSSSGCAVPGLGVFSICKPTAGGAAQWTDEGSLYAKWPPKAAIPPSLTCDITIAAGGKATLSNCQ